MGPKKYFYIFFIGILYGGEVMGGNLIMMNASYTNAFYAAATDFRKLKNGNNYSSLIEDDGSIIRVVFSESGKEPGSTRGGGKSQVVYTISKNDFRILDISGKLGR